MATKGSTKSKKAKKKKVKKPELPVFDQRAEEAALKIIRTHEERGTRSKLEAGWANYTAQMTHHLRRAAAGDAEHLLYLEDCVHADDCDCPGPFYVCIQFARSTDTWLIPLINDYLMRELIEDDYGWDTLYRAKILACKLLERWKTHATPALDGLRYCAEKHQPITLRKLAKRVIKAIEAENAKSG